MILIDAGPLIALANPDDPAHAAALKILEECHSPLVSTWPVLAEAAWILRKQPLAVQEMLAGFVSGAFQLRQLEPESLTWISRFLRKYQNIRAQLADATLMYVAEHDNIQVIFTLDRRDFSVYRTSKNRALKVIP